MGWVGGGRTWGRMCSYFTLTWRQFSSIKKKQNKKKIFLRIPFFCLYGCLPPGEQATSLSHFFWPSVGWFHFPCPLSPPLHYNWLSILYSSFSSSSYHRGIVSTAGSEGSLCQSIVFSWHLFSGDRDGNSCTEHNLSMLERLRKG